MRIVITVPGRLHAFATARELERRGHLGKVITPLPPFRIQRHSTLSPSYFSTQWVHAAYRVLAPRVAGQAPRRQALKDALDAELFDWSASRALPRGLDVCIGYAGSFLRTQRRAHALGARTVVERHSAHRRVQMQLLAEEHARLGLPFHSTHRLMERELAEYVEADAISVPSAFVERTFREQGFAADKLIRVPLGADLGRFHPHPRENTRFRVVFAGSFSVRKGVKYLLEAWQRLALPDAELWFVGSVDSTLRELLRPEDVPGVKLLGHVPEDQLAQRLSQCDVLCLPSIEDGFGMVMAQAMACGLAVLHSSNTGGADLVRPGIDGFEVAIRDSEGLATRIEELYRDRDRSRPAS